MSLTESLTGVGRINATDVDECAEAHRPWQMRHTQLSLGGFRTQTNFVRTERVTVYRQWWNRRVMARGESPADHVTFGTTGNGSAQLKWCGRDLSSQRLAWTQPGGEVDFSTSERSDHVVALIRTDVLAGYEGDAEPPGESHGFHIDCPAQMGRELIVTIQSMLARYADQPNLLKDPRECVEFESEMLSALFACANWGPSPSEDQPRRREALRAATTYAESLCKPIAVPQLADAVGVSQRTLEYAFREGLGVTPLQFMRRCRLNRAHHDLRSATPGSKSVTDVAVSWGFRDLGRFATEYRRVFGVNPSQTLAQARSPIAHLHP